VKSLMGQSVNVLVAGVAGAACAAGKPIHREDFNPSARPTAHRSAGRPRGGADCVKGRNRISHFEVLRNPIPTHGKVRLISSAT